MRFKLLLARAWLQYAAAKWLRRSAIRMLDRSKTRMRLADKFDAVGDTLWRAANKVEHAADQKQAAILRADRGRS